MTEIVINQRSYSTFLSLKDELDLIESKNYLFFLDYLSLITISGERAGEFLQGQLSCDVNLVSDHSIQQGAYCNLKGRVQTLVDVINWDGYKLILPKDLIEPTTASLNKTAIVSRVKLATNSNYRFYGFLLNNLSSTPFNVLKEKEMVINEFGACYAIDKRRYIFIVPEEQHSKFSHQFSSFAESRGSLAWHYLQLKHLTSETYPSTQGIFLPHRLELPTKGYVSFNKGCYKGQEIIARTHYRATIKHGLQTFILKSELVVTAGDLLINAVGQEVGELIDFCPLGNQEFLILASVLLTHDGEVFIKASV